MSDEAIKAALEAGAQAVCRFPDGLSCNSSQPEPACAACQMQAAAAIEAFLRALPDGMQLRWGDAWWSAIDAEQMAALAAAAARAAQEGGR